MLCHDIIESQPEQYDRAFCHLTGAYSETQWYWPPAVGADDASSASESTTWELVNHGMPKAISSRSTHEELSNGDLDHRPEETGETSISQADPTGSQKNLLCTGTMSVDQVHRNHRPWIRHTP